MKIRKIAAVAVLVLGSLAADNVAPSKAELEAMYDKAFRAFDANNFPDALKELDAIDARQPDLAESQNLRGVILMRQAQYDQAEGALQKALATDPKFWNARFNLAEIPFLRKDWAEARKRFEGLLQGNASELQGDAAQLIQYKILLTYLLEGKENMVDSILTKFELTPDTPAVTYSNAAVAFQHKNEKEARDLIATAEKKFSPALNKLFAESLYEVGWMQKPAGQTRVALEITTAADRAAKAKAIATEKFEAAEQAFQQRDYTAAKRLIDETDAAEPNQPATINLRGEILLAQKDFDGAENAFKQAAKIDPKFREAQYNLAQIPFKKKEYTKARDRFEALFNNTPAPGGDKNQAAQIIKFKIYLTLLLEGKDSRAQKMMEQFQFTRDTPALYYAQAAWEFKHNNAAKANDWIVSARKIYSPALNDVFADSFYDLGLLQNQSTTPATGSTEVAKVESTPSIEPSPIAAVVASNKTAKQPDETVTQKVPSTATGEVPATDKIATTAPASSPQVEMPVVSNALPAETRAPLPPEPERNPVTDTAASAATQQKPATDTTLAQQKPATDTTLAQQKPATDTAASTVATEQKSAANVPVPAPNAANSEPSTVLAPATVQEWPQTTGMDGIGSRKNIIVSVLLLAAFGLLAWVVVSEVRRRVNVPVYHSPAPAMGPRFETVQHEPKAEKVAPPSRLAGGPPQVSLQLKASEPSVRRAAVPFGKMNRPFGAGATIATGNGTVVESPAEIAPVREPEPSRAPAARPRVQSAPAPFTAVEQAGVADATPASLPEASALATAPEWEFAPARSEAVSTPEFAAPPAQEASMFAQTPATFDAPPAFEPQWPAEAVSEPVAMEAVSEPVIEAVSEPVMTEAVGEPWMAEAVSEPVAMEAVSEPMVETVSEPIMTEAVGEPWMAEAVSEPVAMEAVSEPVIETVSEPVMTEAVGEPWMAEAVSEPVAMEAASEPVTSEAPT